LTLLFVVALAVRVGAYALGSDRPNGDEIAYQELAEEIAAGGGLARGGVAETHIAPLLPLLHAVPIALGAEPQAAGRSLALLISSLAAPLVAWALAPLLAPRWLLAAAGAVALHPRLLLTAERMQPEALSALLLLLFAGWWVRDCPWGVAVASALAYLARPEAVLLLPLAWVVVLVANRPSWRRWLAPSALALLMVSPYLAHLRSATGQWTVTGKASWVYAMGVAEARQGDEPVPFEELRRLESELVSPWAHARQHPWAAASGYLGRLGRALGYLGSALWWPLLALAVVGVVDLWRAGAAVGGVLLPLSLVLALPVGVVFARHLLPYLPLLLGVAARGGGAIVARLKATDARMAT
jgi:hypothetical protein